MHYIARSVEKYIHTILSQGKSILLLGPRQTGKSTTLKRLKADLFITFIRPQVRQQYEQSPAQLTAEIEALNCSSKPLVIVDEVQKVPRIMDEIQYLIDENKAQFILTGSSARRLKDRQHINLLPGRVILIHMDPLTLTELPPKDMDLESRLLYGSLPEVANMKNDSLRESYLNTYVSTYLEEEIRAEAIVRNVASFSQFLRLAALDSGNPINTTRLSQDIGVAHTTIQSYYQILEDCLIAGRIESLPHRQHRRQIMKAAKYIYFDLGVRRSAAQEGIHVPEETLGHWFKQFVGLELLRLSRDKSSKLYYWRTYDGPEVDWIIAKENTFIPIEVKWQQKLKTKSLQHIKRFMAEYPEAKVGYIVARIPRKQQIDRNIYAIPWQALNDILVA